SLIVPSGFFFFHSKKEFSSVVLCVLSVLEFVFEYEYPQNLHIRASLLIISAHWVHFFVSLGLLSLEIRSLKSWSSIIFCFLFSSVSPKRSSTNIPKTGESKNENQNQPKELLPLFFAILEGIRQMSEYIMR